MKILLSLFVFFVLLTIYWLTKASNAEKNGTPESSGYIAGAFLSSVIVIYLLILQLIILPLFSILFKVLKNIIKNVKSR